MPYVPPRFVPRALAVGLLAGALLLLGALGYAGGEKRAEQEEGDVAPRYSVLVFSKTDTAGYRHASIPDGVAAIRRMGERHYFEVDATENASVFRPESLAKYEAVVFLSTSGDVLNGQQQAAFERYVRAGGGFVGVHGAAATEYDWPWYSGLVGAVFGGHPEVQEAAVVRKDAAHPSTLHLPSRWARTDEWYNFRTDPSDSVHVLLELDEASYEGGTMGKRHPIAWMHEYDGGRAFYTGLGHTRSAFAEPLFLQHLREGIEWAAGGLGNFAEAGFPFITTTVDAGGLAAHVPERNTAVRGIALRLGNGTYACFDPDLLRMSVGWTGGFLSMETMAQVSYHQPLNKSNGIPRVLGRPVFGTGIYAGWGGAAPAFEDPRPPGPNPEDVGRGPLPAGAGRWKGLYAAGDTVLLSYSVRGTDVLEQPGSMRAGPEVGITRTFRTGAAAQPLTLVAAEVPGAAAARVDSTRGGGAAAVLTHGAAGDTVTAVGAVGLPEGARLAVRRGRYVTLALPEGTPPARFRVVLWTGPRARLARFQEMLRAPVTMASVEEIENGGSAYWPRAVATRGAVAPDTSAFVLDELALPMPNPWKRNVRAADVDFFEDGRAAIVTFSGDVWLLSGIDAGLERLRWRRFASGLYEPLSIGVVEGEIYVYGREGITRLHDLDGNGEADFYESFADGIIQSTETREWPLAMTKRPGGGFYVTMGAALNAGPRTAASREAAAGFRVSSRHGGTVATVSADGRRVEVYADGFREPYLGTAAPGGLVTASDQQGNFVPSTPLYVVREGGYYGVPATAGARRGPLPEPAAPLTWIPHQADPSGAGQVWVTGEKMGPLSGQLVHLSYGRPGPFRVYADTARGLWQGGAAPLPGRYATPTLKGRVHPEDGQLYVAGFQVWGSKAEKISSLARLRYTGRPGTLPTALQAGQQGVLLRFEQPLAPAAAADPANYAVRRWDYRRTEEYGSGHFKPDGGAGEERLPVAAAHLADDRRAVLLVLPDMRPVMQMQVDYAIESAAGQPLESPLYLTLNGVRPLDLGAAGFGGIDWQKDLRQMDGRLAAAPAPEEEEAEATARRGRHIYQEVGCVACHSLDGSERVGPTLAKLYNAERPLENGTTIVADEAYLERSIWDASSQVVKGYGANMPSYEGVLGDAEVEALVLFIRSLSDSSTAAGPSSVE